MSLIPRCITQWMYNDYVAYVFMFRVLNAEIKRTTQTDTNACIGVSTRLRESARERVRTVVIVRRGGYVCFAFSARHTVVRAPYNIIRGRDRLTVIGGRRRGPNIIIVPRVAASPARTCYNACLRHCPAACTSASLLL